MPVEFLVFHDIDLVISHVENNVYIEEVQEDEDDDMEGPDMGNMFCDDNLPLYLSSTRKVSEISMN